MIHDIIVHIPTEAPATPAIECAVSVAAAFDAHLDGVVCAYEEMNASVALAASATFLEATSSATRNDAAKRLDEFEVKARAARIAHGVRTVSDAPALANDTLAEMTRLYDLSVVAQNDPAKPSHYIALAESLLFGSGRPVLLVPYIFSGAMKIERALICWDGSRAAARAVHDALPFLRKASDIEVVAINEDETSETSATALIAHLARKELAARANRFACEPGVIHSSILSLAADNSADLLVMGGYGHSRLRERILGGVTRGMLKSLTVPALISH